jgi:hypothetical protein
MNKKRPPNFGDRETRLRTAYERLGCTNPHCIICGEPNPLRLEQHHPAQHEFDGETIPLCASHHKDASDWQKDHPQKIPGCTSPLEPIAHWLFGLGDLLRIASQEPAAEALKELLIYIADKLHKFARTLVDFARAAVEGPAS